MAEIEFSNPGNPIDISGLLNQILPLMTTILSLMMTVYLLKMVFGMFAGFGRF